MNKQQILSELKQLNLPTGEYAVFGSGPIAIREIRESSDIDIIVTKKLFDKLKKENTISHTKLGDERILIRDIEFFYTWRDINISIEELIKTAEIIEGFPFVKLDYVKQWKQNRGKEKDFKDIELIDKFLKKNN